MTSISGASHSAVVWDRSKPLKLPDDFYEPEDPTSGYARFMESVTSGVPLVADNRPDNVWGKITLSNGDTATIYNKGSVETDHTMLDIDWSLDGEANRAEAIMAKYGGTLEIAETVDPDAPMVASSDAATLLSTILDSPALVDRMLSSPEHQLLPDDLMAAMD
jgi:hypothetical protein